MRTPLTQVVAFPFDLFGNAGTSAGAQLLYDYVEELLTDNDAEQNSGYRPKAYDRKVVCEEHEFPDLKALSNWRSLAREDISGKLQDRHRIIWLGGNHLSVLPIYEELGKQKDKVVVLQADAHLDIQQFHDVTEDLANGNFLLHAEGKLPSIVNIGHRDLLTSPKLWSKKFTAAYSSLDCSTRMAEIKQDLIERFQAAGSVWLDIDCDVFDPAYAPAVHHPLPCGMAPRELLELFELAFQYNVIGVSISEFDPSRDRNDTTLSLLGWLIEWLLLKWYESK